jgi:hypothetical protein
MISTRNLALNEKRLLDKLLRSKPDTLPYLKDLEEVQVLQMADGGMGSLKLIPKGQAEGHRRLGKAIAVGEFLDTDGIAVSVVVNVDTSGKLFELDIWKVDFSPVLTWPLPECVRIVS